MKMLFTGPDRPKSVRIGRNCALGLSTALGLQRRAADSRPWAQFLIIRTSQPVNSVYLLYTLWRLCDEIFTKFVEIVSAIYKKALKVQILNEVALRQVVYWYIKWNLSMHIKCSVRWCYSVNLVLVELKQRIFYFLRRLFTSNFKFLVLDFQ